MTEALDKLIRDQLRLVAENPSTTPETLATLATNNDDVTVALVAGNPSTPPEVLDTLARDSDEDVRHAVAMNPSTPPKALTLLAFDRRLLVRMEAESNPNTAPEVLEAVYAVEDREILVGLEDAVRVSRLSAVLASSLPTPTDAEKEGMAPTL